MTQGVVYHSLGLVGPQFTSIPKWAGNPAKNGCKPNVPPSVPLGRQAPDLGATVEELARAGVKFERHNFPGVDEKGIWTPPGSDTKIAWFKDPHGNILSLTQFSPRFLHKGC